MIAKDAYTRTRCSRPLLSIVSDRKYTCTDIETYQITTISVITGT